ncbi:nucleotidyltransferase [Solibacillus sp. CAU 1738]|uniref:nucleotidyltransferase n=1 Tax=Solibacillus sp. CAU 1738 TaxID=3140363 RepID=UPI003261A27C
MQAVGVVVEYNPFHNGHAYHAEQAKKITEADAVIAVMSGQFLQRGEPALVDKWARTKMALASGVDIVIELPYVFSTAQANQFAYGAIFLLSAMQCKTFAFGSEDGRITPFINSFELINKNRTQYNALIKQYMSLGISYPKALHEAYAQLQQQFSGNYIDLAQPNNILGLHYIEAAQTLKSPIRPVTIPRIGAGYHDDADKMSSIASATGIRKALFEAKDLTNVEQFMPTTSLAELTKWQQSYNIFGSWEAFWPLLKFAILRHTPEQLTAFADVTEGLQYALIKHAKTSNSFIEFMTLIKSKRYTWTRLQRMLTHIYTGITKEQLHSYKEPSYIRLLGMTDAGQRYLSEHKKHFDLPLISRVAAVQDNLLEIDLHATTMYGIGINLHTNKKIDGDFKTPPIRL